MGTGKNEEKHRKTWRIKEKHGKHRERGENIGESGENTGKQDKT